MKDSFSFTRLRKHWAPLLLTGLLGSGNLGAAVHVPKPGPGLALESVLTAVKRNDYRLKQFQEESNAFLAESDAASYLPDPTVFAAIQSLPTDTFKLDQEPMTQLRMGVKQMFPKGDVLDIKSDMSGIQSEQALIRSQLRWLMRKQAGEQAWLEAWYWQKRLAILDEDQVFLEQVQDFVRSLYEVGARDQSDLLGAELELIKLNEKRIEAQRTYQQFRQQLNTLANQQLPGENLVQTLPDLRLMDLVSLKDSESAQYFLKHPRIALLDQQVALADKKVDLSEQDFEPAWGVEVSYGLRDGNNMDGSDRADFLSAGISVQVPLFSRGKQNQNKQAALKRSSSAQIQRDEALSEMRFELANLIQQYRYTDQQRVLYETDILPTLKKQTQSALQSYEADRGNFNLVMNLFLKEQDAKTMHQRLRVNEQKLISSLNYMLGLDSAADLNGAP